MTTTPPRKRGRPRKPRPEPAEPAPRRRPELPPLPFAMERESIAAEVDGVLPTKAHVSPGPALLPVDVHAEVTHLPVRVPGIRFEMTDAQRAEALHNIREFAKHGVTGLSASSRRTMLADWITWLAFCRHHNRPALPVAFDDLRVFIDTLMLCKRKRATIEHHLYTIRWASTFYGCPDPMGSLVAKAYWRDLCRDDLVAAKRQAEGLRLEDVEAMVAPLDLNVAQQARDAALVRLAYDLMARRNELAKARWTDFKLPAKGSGRYLVPRSKTDQEGQGTLLALSEPTVQALRAWRVFANDELPYVIQPMKPRHHRQGPDQGKVIVRPIDSGEIPKIWNRLATAAGLGTDGRSFSGHSARVGATQDLTDAGAEVTLLMKLGRWKTPTQPARYGEAGLADRAMEKRQELLEQLHRKKKEASNAE